MNRADNGFDHHRGQAPLLRPTGWARVALFTGLALAVFAVVNALWHYLGTGRWVDLSLGSFRRALASPLGATFLHPLSVFGHPWMILVDGLLLGVVLFVPVTVAVLYRLVVAAAFVLVVALVGHAPVLAAAMALGCLLAGRTRLRSDKPLLASLLGLAPIAAYLYVFGFLGMDSALALPMQRVVLYAPLVAALVAAVVGVTLVLLMARLTRYRPGVIWPVLTLMLVAPLAIFVRQVGTDELEYSLITAQLGGAGSLLEPVALETWRKQHDAQGLAAGALPGRLKDDLQQQRGSLMERCRRFVKRHPTSPRVPAVLWLRGQAASLTLDEQALEMGVLERGLVRYSASHVQDLSGAYWDELVRQYDHAPQAALAHWRLGELALRGLDVQGAVVHLRTARKRLAELVLQPKPPESRITQVFTPTASFPAQRYYEEALLETERLLWLVRCNNAVGDPGALEALGALLRLDPHQLDYYRELGRLAGQYEATAMGDNLKLAVAMATPNLYERAEMLIPLARDEQTDSSIEATYELGRLALRTAEAPALPLVQQLKTPQEYFERVVSAPDNPFGRPAAQHLVWLKSATQPVNARTARAQP